MGLPVITIVHGGQTGVDRGAHEAALANGWDIAGHMPRDGRDERGPIPPEVARYLRTYEKASYAARTEANVRDCDALLVVARDAEDPYGTPGTAKTLSLAIVRGLCWKIVDPSFEAIRIARWIWDRLPRSLVLPLASESAVRFRLMIAGPRESKWTDARVETADLLRRVAVELKALEAEGTRRTA
jgi:hypothetical protein